MRTPLRLSLACAGIAAMLAVSGCSGSDFERTAAASSEATSVPTTAQSDEGSPTTEPTALPAGIPTAEPSVPATTGQPTLDVSVLMTLATVDPDNGGLLLGGYVSGVVEDGGDCVYVVTPERGEPLVIHKDGVENNGSTSCGSTTLDPSLVPPGSYSVVLEYSNDAGRARSDVVMVDVP